jgi:hypothetical protein
MGKEKKASRFESNKQLRQIFSRHSVDLSQMTFSCSTHSLSLNGCLKKNTGGDFTFKGVEALVEEINRLLHHPTIYSELENWTISSSSISMKGGLLSEATPSSQKSEKKSA